jgi:hypothetical protein
MRSLKDIRWSLDALRVDLNDYEGEERETVHHMYTVEGALAGIARRVGERSRVRIPTSHFKLLTQPLVEGSTWIRSDGTRYDLEKDGDLLDFGLVLDEMRRALLAKVAVPRTRSAQR